MFLDWDERLRFGGEETVVRAKWVPVSLAERCATRWMEDLGKDFVLETLRGLVPDDVWDLLRRAFLRRIK